MLKEMIDSQEKAEYEAYQQRQQEMQNAIAKKTTFVKSLGVDKDEQKEVMSLLNKEIASDVTDVKIQNKTAQNFKNKALDDVSLMDTLHTDKARELEFNKVAVKETEKSTIRKSTDLVEPQPVSQDRPIEIADQAGEAAPLRKSLDFVPVPMSEAGYQGDQNAGINEKSPSKLKMRKSTRKSDKSVPDSTTAKLELKSESQDLPQEQLMKDKEALTEMDQKLMELIERQQTP